MPFSDLSSLGMHDVTNIILCRPPTFNRGRGPGDVGYNHTLNQEDNVVIDYEPARTRFLDAIYDPDFTREMLIAGIFNGTVIGLDELERIPPPLNAQNRAEELITPIQLSYRRNDPDMALAIELALVIDRISTRNLSDQTITDIARIREEAVNASTDDLILLIAQASNIENGFNPAVVNVIPNVSDLHEAVRSDNFEMVMLLVSMGVDINGTDAEGNTALDISAQIIRDAPDINTRVRQRDITKLLLTKKARPGFATILCLIGENNHGIETYLNIILQNHPDIFGEGDGRIDLNATTSGEFTLLIMAILSDNVAIVDFLLNQGVNFNGPDRAGLTPLMHAVRVGYFAIIERLLKEDEVNADRGDDSNTTPLMIAVQNGRLDIVEALIKANSNVNAANNDGNTALMYAAQRDNLAIAKALVKEGADVDIENKRGETAEDFAKHKKSGAITEYIRQQRLNRSCVIS